MSPAASDAASRLATVARQAIRLISSLDAEAFRPLFTEDSVMEFPFPAPGMPSRIEGRNDVIKALGGASDLFRTLSLEIEQLHVCPETSTVVIEASSAGTLRSSASYTNRYAMIFGFTGDKISLWREYFDPRQIPG